MGLDGKAASYCTVEWFAVGRRKRHDSGDTV